MATLEELYQTKRVLENIGSQPPHELLEQIAEAEKKLTSEKLLAIIEDNFPQSLPDVGQPVNAIVIAEYLDNRLTRVGFRDLKDLAGVFESLPYVREVVPDTDEVEEVEEVEEEIEEDDGLSRHDDARSRSKSIPFEVRFADGKTVYYTNAQRTMIEALKYMGLERVSHFSDEDFMGYRLVDVRQRVTTPQRTWQKYVDGWWIYICMGNYRKIRCLQGLSKQLNIPLQIIPRPRSEADLFSTPVEVQSMPLYLKGGNRTYSLNGSLPMKKNRSVLATVKLLLHEFPTVTFQDVEDMFPKNLQGSYGVVRTIEDIEQRKLRNKTESERWFLDESEIMTAADGIRFAVSSEWGDNFVNFQKHIFDSWGWTIEEA